MIHFLLDLFKDSFSSFNLSVIFPIDEFFIITYIESIELFNHFTLKSVLYVPQFQFNLLSINALTQTHCYSIQFEYESYFIQDCIQGKMIEMGKCSSNLYVLDPTNLFPTLFCISGVCNNVSKTDHELWHTHLGHPSYVRLNL